MNLLVTFLFNDSPWTIIIVLLVVVLLFGGKKIPELMRGMGSGIKEFKDAVKDEDKKKPEDPNTNSTNSNSNSTN
jgi:sec-independent protein translocase protein TatA